MERLRFKYHFLSRETWAALGFLLPLVGFVVIFILVPVLGTLADSFFLDVTYRPKRFLGADNFIWLLNDPAFGRALRFTGLFVLVSVPLEVILGLIIALVLNERLPLRGVMRAAVLIPWAIPAVVSGRIFELIYNYSYGVANYVLTTLHLTQQPVNWLGSEVGAFLALVAADSWKTTPFAAIILLAGLSAIPDDLYRQAKVDRANCVQRFFMITLPLLKPVLIVVLLFRTIEALRVFDLIFVLTGGGPGGATTSVSLFGYNFFSAGDFGYGSAASVILFIMAFGVSLGLVRLGRVEQGVMP
ncbi:MAG: sugar ABC transporter permease [Desulfobacterales bacterium]|nr:MAG: sugar ABC transporter permease [Desulfobacterales bacterium]